MTYWKSVRRPVFAVLCCLAIIGTQAALQHAEAKSNKNATGAAIVGGLAGAMIGAAIADAAKPKKKIYYESYVPPYKPGYYDPYFNQAFSPTTGIVCYPAQGLCYNNTGSVSGSWTRKVYGY